VLVGRELGCLKTERILIGDPEKKQGVAVEFQGEDIRGKLYQPRRTAREKRKITLKGGYGIVRALPKNIGITRRSTAWKKQE